jgi:hypothetical protein
MSEQSAAAVAAEPSAPAIAAAEVSSPPAPTAPSTDPVRGHARIDEIIALSHSTKPADKQAYEVAQPELERLIRETEGKPKPSAPARDATEATPGIKPAAEAKATEAADPDFDVDAVPATPTDYRVELPESDIPRGEIDSGMLAAALETFHEEAATQREVSIALKALAAADARQAAIVAEKTNAARAELRDHFGDNVDAEIKRANEWLRSELGQRMNLPTDLLQARLPDGSLLGSNAAFVVWANEQAAKGKTSKSEATDSLIRPGSSETRAEGVARRIDEIVKLAHTNVREYERLQPELHRLMAEELGRKSRK